MENDTRHKPNNSDGKTSFRFMVVSKVLAEEARGVVRPNAVQATAEEVHQDEQGRASPVSERTIYRWLKLFEEHGLAGLQTAQRKNRKPYALDSKLLAYLVGEKQGDPHASVPELLKRATQNGLLGHATKVDRSTVWRALKEAGVTTRRGRKSKKLACRRFAYPHRMNMVLCDGKHFRAGPERVRRVALFFIDDATRMLLSAVVGTTENTTLFLRGLHGCIIRYGLMKALYVDNGSGFKGNDSRAVLEALEVAYILGTPRYPEGRGKVERFNQTIWNALLRGFPGNPEIGTSCAELEHQLQHYVFRIYNHEPHEGIDNQTPAQRFHEDSVALDHLKDQSILEQKFVLSTTRKVSKDHVVSLEGTLYEVPQGYARQVITLYRNMLSGEVSILHKAHYSRLAPLEAHDNARRPCNRKASPETETGPSVRPTSAEQDYRDNVTALVDSQGNCFKSQEDNDE